MKKAWAFVAEAWAKHGPCIAGGRGFKAIQYQSVRMSHPPLPIFMYLLALCVVCSNGATMQVFGTLAPLALWILNVNYSQTRKSCLTMLAEKICAKVDRYIAKQVKRMMKVKWQKQNGQLPCKQTLEDALEEALGEVLSEEEDQANVSGTAEEQGSFPGIWSVAFLGGTTERVKERCAGNYSQVRGQKLISKLPG